MADVWSIKTIDKRFMVKKFQLFVSFVRLVWNLKNLSFFRYFLCSINTSITNKKFRRVTEILYIILKFLTEIKKKKSAELFVAYCTP